MYHQENPTYSDAVGATQERIQPAAPLVAAAPVPQQPTPPPPSDGLPQSAPTPVQAVTQPIAAPAPAPVIMTSSALGLFDNNQTEFSTRVLDRQARNSPTKKRKASNIFGAK